MSTQPAEKTWIEVLYAQDEKTQALFEKAEDKGYRMYEFSQTGEFFMERRYESGLCDKAKIYKGKFYPNVVREF